MPRTGRATANTAPGVQTPLTEPLSGGRRGGTLTVLNETDFEHLDPGVAYFSVDYEVVYATQRPLYSNLPNSKEPTPDLAAGPPQIGNEGRVVTVKLKRGVHFSPPVNREVTSADVAYAIERGLNPHVANPYVLSYFGSVEGMSTATGAPVKGIATPNKHEIVFKLTEPDAQVVVDALQLPLSAPVPKSYARKFDRHRPSNYGDYEVATGPYMLRNNASGKVLGIGYMPGRSATLVRNRNWRRSTDLRPAYLNEVRIKIGGSSAANGAKVLASRNSVENQQPAVSTVRAAYAKHPSQLEVSPDAGSRYVAVNNAHGPFTNINLRKALWAALDRSAMDGAFGGEPFATVATHFIYPGIPGFEQAGGLTGPRGPQFDYDEHPGGDMAIAEKYVRLARFPSGRYTGGQTVSVVGATGAPFEQDAEIVNQALNNLGFATKFALLPAAVMFAEYCNVPKEEIDVCPSVAWIADFSDPQAVLNVTFNGKYIAETGNVNWGQTNLPKINEAMARAVSITGTGPRATAWAQIDDELVEDAAAIPFDWQSEAMIEGRRVRGVGDIWNTGSWDYSWTSLK
ncbi:MAG TPA: ABC transporter substrate-binding protein [Solirubrobacteraceae bacterium]|nr:ABC transporter substrate-binding protein [Solirubrobacteraceae bacterium]